MLLFRHRLFFLPVIFVLAVYGVRHVVSPPEAVARSGELRAVESVRLFHDTSWLNAAGERQLEQSVFDEVFRMIREAGSFVLVDMFLFNDWQGPVAETHRPLSTELVSALNERLQRDPDVTIIVITDPINTVYGGMASQHVDSLRLAGVHVILTDLKSLQDSNPVYSALWRGLVSPFGNATGGWLPNPFGPGRVSLRSWLALLNFKANHRKLIVADDVQGRLYAMVTSANPHDGSSAHRNVGVRFDGAVVDDIVSSERALLELSGAVEVVAHLDSARLTLSSQADTGSVERLEDSELAMNKTQLQLITESAIRDTVLQSVQQTVSGDELELSMFYLSHRSIVKALKAAATRGVRVRALLDVNSDAFGRRKNGVPNVPVAAELVEAGAEVRWCATKGEQCHEKSLLIKSANGLMLITGSGNFTRRNLDDYNLETDVVLRAPVDDRLLNSISGIFDERWNNVGDRTYSTSYENHADDSLWLKLQYRIMEATGLGTF